MRKSAQYAQSSRLRSRKAALLGRARKAFDYARNVDELAARAVKKREPLAAEFGKSP